MSLSHYYNNNIINYLYIIMYVLYISKMTSSVYKALDKNQKCVIIYLDQLELAKAHNSVHLIFLFII